MIYLVAGTRPNFMKVAPVWRALHARGTVTRLIHTGQHFDSAMSDVFFRDLGMPEPDVRLQAGGGTHAEQTAAVLVGVERDLVAHPPGAVVVVGDVTSTMAAALAAAKLGIPVVHVEAGLRSRDWTMPEEINRVLTDRLSDLLLTTTPGGGRQPAAEGIAVGADPLRRQRDDRLAALGARAPDGRARAIRASRGEYALATLHRPANVDTRESLAATLDALAAIAARVPLLFPVHPRTVARAELLGSQSGCVGRRGFGASEPLGYNDFVTLMARASSSRPILAASRKRRRPSAFRASRSGRAPSGRSRSTEGTNVIVGLDVERIARAVDAVVAGRVHPGRVPEGWDGRAGERIADAIQRLLEGDPAPLTAGARA